MGNNSARMFPKAIKSRPSLTSEEIAIQMPDNQIRLIWGRGIMILYQFCTLMMGV